MRIIAHRGASGYAPENTLPAMERAIQQNAQGLELDVQLTADGQVVVIHDWTLDRTTSGTGAVKDLSLKEIQAHDAGSWKDSSFAGTRVPTLQEVIDLIPDTLLLNVEIKIQAFDRRDIETPVVDILKKNNRLEHTVISSFNHECLSKVHQLDKTVKLGCLYEANLMNPLEYFEQMGVEFYSVHLDHDYVSAPIVDLFHAQGLQVYSWTVNTRETAQALQGMGIDGVITNYPDMLDG
ncbi:glycerophosphoryl diester phosphodiesterase [Alkalispirochaeta americana]|uniref:Glycerophosphoryl diester phosphodiesterase n=1 Tax=Alkalispirochaeta americana TaxID=159291 RepID=A0A1N6XGQ3_9SPIO|nr:glycerophosphodiester phosphodiesterase [Alkalispirochaeta americana]SIR01515.1 glycerophosphoryl diester phosphodiesterase [Alkalispirochaeta americana]